MWIRCNATVSNTRCACPSHDRRTLTAACRNAVRWSRLGDSAFSRLTSSRMKTLYALRSLAVRGSARPHKCRTQNKVLGGKRLCTATQLLPGPN
eukprot:349741-Chlamydomonas_euryale.AAC.6